MYPGNERRYSCKSFVNNALIYLEQRVQFWSQQGATEAAQSPETKPASAMRAVPTLKVTKMEQT
jgi:hypothetical protein